MIFFWGVCYFGGFLVAVYCFYYFYFYHVLFIKN